MGFRQKNEKKHQWDRFCRSNRELILQAGLPYGMIENFDAFENYLEEGYVGLRADNTIVSYGPGATYFKWSQLTPIQREVFLELLHRYSETPLGNEHYLQKFSNWFEISPYVGPEGDSG